MSITEQQRKGVMRQIDLIDPIDDLDTFEVEFNSEPIAISNGLHDDDYSRYEV